MLNAGINASAVLLLEVAGASGSKQETWDSFVAARAELSSRMELATCNGCDGCGLRCMSGFTVSEPEYDAVAAYLTILPAADVERVLGQEKVQPWPGAEDTGATVEFCRFRDMENGNCFVYPVRPTVCRLFGHTYWLPCPIGAITSIPEGGARLWDNYQKFEKRGWDEWASEKASRTTQESTVPPHG
jgi:Fe-S-cluster containining protein